MLSISSVYKSKKVSTIAVAIGSSVLLAATYQPLSIKPSKVATANTPKLVNIRSTSVLGVSNLPGLLPNTTINPPAPQRAVVVHVAQTPPTVVFNALASTQPLSVAQRTSSVPAPQNTQAHLAPTVSLASRALNTASTVPTAQGAAPTSAAQQNVRSIIASVFPPSDVNKAVAVATCESNLNATEVSAPNLNGTRDWGVMQINDGGTLQNLLVESGQSPTNLNQALDPTWNVKAGYTLFTQRGWAPWTCAYKLGIVSKLYTNIPGINWGM